MNEQPAPPSSPPPPGEHGTGDDGAKLYNQITDKVGGPSFRLGDNLASFFGAFVGLVVGAVFGLIIGMNSSSMSMWMAVVGFGFLGMVGGAFLVGLCLMVIGLVRK